MSDVREVYADLVIPTGQRSNADKRVPVESLQNFVSCSGDLAVAGVRPGRHQHATTGAGPANWQIDRSGIASQITLQYRQIRFGDAPRFESRAEAAMRQVMHCHHHCARGFPIKTMDHARRSRPRMPVR